MKKRFEINIQGRVQGVGFRFFVLKVSKNYNITGYVKNLDNGNVEIVCEADEKEFEKFKIGLLLNSKKDSQIEIENIEVTINKFKNEFTMFSIAY